MTPAETEAFGEVLAVYLGSDGDATRALYARLEKLGAAGAVAVNLFRAHKASARAKLYRGGLPGQGSYRRMAYDRKQWALDNLCSALLRHAEALGLVWGWGVDPQQPMHCNVLYLDLPGGQVSFHTAGRGEGPDYAGGWDGVRDVGAERVCRWIAAQLAAAEACG